MTPTRALVVGFGVTGHAVARALVRRGADVLAVDDHPSVERRERAESLGVELVESPRPEQWRALVAGRDAVLPTPGLPDHHPVFATAADAGVEIWSEFDLAREWDARPLLAITGTNGKTTVTVLATAMLEASGTRATAAGNTDVPLVTAIDDPDIEVFVVEASSFRLGHTRRFTPAVATWLNFAEDHLDIHRSVAAYEAAKARIWRDLTAEQGVCVANSADPAVMRNRNPRARTVTFGAATSSSPPGDFTVRNGELTTPTGESIVGAGELHRSLPHDVDNALAAAATALEGGAHLDGVRRALREFRGLPHRVELVAEHGGVRWYDDSKATTPHATLAALAGFDSVVLIAGGRNKGIDLAPLATAGERVRAVVAIGEAAPEVAAAFAGTRPVDVAATMRDAVALAAGRARPGDAVVLSPGCASFDWFSSYAERGDVFAREVRRHLGIEEEP